MADTTIGKVLAAMEAEPHRGCSDLYRWLRKHHAALTAALLTHRSPLRVLLIQVHEAGIVGRRGQCVSYESLRKTWKRVCRDVSHGSPTGTVPMVRPSRMPPSRISPDARPLEATGHLLTEGGPGRASEGGVAPAVPVASGHRPLKVFTSLEDIKPWQPTSDPDPAPDSGASGVLPPSKWPKPVM
jgi:hypothetical protein